MKFSVLEHVSNSQDEVFMQQALALALQAQAHQEVPVGALVVCNNQVIGEGFNQPVSSHDPSAHAELLAIRQACVTQNNYRLSNCTLYVTLSPCLMCLGACLHARLTRVVIGNPDSRFSPPLQPLLSHFEASPAWSACCFETGCLQHDCQAVLQSFFQARRPSRLARLAQVRDVMDLPNVNQAVAQCLRAMGLNTGADFLTPSVQFHVDRIEAMAQGMSSVTQADEIAMLRSLSHYLQGHSVSSWKHFKT